MRLPSRLLPRKINSHKGDFGHIFVIGGSAKFSGAAILCVTAALRSGAGLVTLGVPESINSAIIKIKPLEAMTLPLPDSRSGSLNLSAYGRIKEFIKKIDVIIIGPGLSGERSTQELARKVIFDLDKPQVIDADGLNALAGHLNLLRSVRERILTPHLGEMARLLEMPLDKVRRSGEKIAKKFAGDYRVTLALKGHNTVVADYKGNSYINKTGNPGMATAGSGDVLTGMLGAFLGQGLKPFEAAKYGVYLHGLAGDLAAKEKTQISLIASDIIAKIPEAIKIANG